MSSPSTSTKQTPAPYYAPASPQIFTRTPSGRPILPAPLPHQRNMGRTSYKPPAHKHAHRLHTIPPREKSTRTLILDHMLWAHARTRLQQARAELGMRIASEFKAEVASAEGGDDTAQDIEEGQQSDGEDVLALKFGAIPEFRRQRPPEQDQYDGSQDLTLAASLRLRADGIEKVLIAMLDQPPEHQPHYADDEAPPTPPAIHGVGEHAFPNGLRFRIALSTLVNDLFARDTPTPLAPTTANTPSVLARIAVGAQGKSPGGISTISLPPPTVEMKPNDYDSFLANGLPKALSSLAPISNFAMLTEREALTSPSRMSLYQRVEQPKSKPDPARIEELYNAGADPTTVNIPPSLRCPRHLHQACAICAPVKQFPQPSTGPSSANSFSPKSPQNVPPRRGAIVLGSNGSKSQIRGTTGNGMGAGLAPWKYGAGIGAGLARPPIDGTVLRRRNVSFHALAEPSAKNAGLCSSSGKLADLIPRFVRLSALVAVELGREAREREEERANRTVGPKDAVEEEQSEDDDDGDDDMDAGDTEKSSPRGGSILKLTHASPYLLSLAYRPTREWYAILCGLLTRAILEGYFCRAWKGKKGMECLVGVGAGLAGQHTQYQASFPSQQRGEPVRQQQTSEVNSKVEPEEDEFAHLDPDDCPTLVEAAKVLFPFNTRSPGIGSSSSMQRRGQGVEDELAYVAEMVYRSKEFETPSEDFSTMLEDLADEYLAEPVERAAVRFCEAVASWRGQPELESYRKKPPAPSSATRFPPTPLIPINSLIQSSLGTLHTLASSSSPSRQTGKPPIEVYFAAPPPPPVTPAKRPRTGSATSVRGAGGSGAAKRTHFEGAGEPLSRGARHADAGDHWTGPYGV